MHEAKIKGDIALAFVIARMTELRWNVGVLLTEHARYDLLAEKDGKMARVQVRSGRLRDGAAEVSLRNSYADKSGCHIKVRSAGDYDFLAVYCPDTKDVYFLDEAMLGAVSSGIRLRTCKAKNGQVKGVRLAENYLTC